MLGGSASRICSAACFAFNNASVRRAVLTGSIVQGMAITVPIGVPLFFIAALVTGNLARGAGFSPTALAALSAAGIMHFVWGRYCNYRATRAIGTNLVGADPAVQSAGHAGAGDLAARRVPHAAEDLRHRADPARADLHDADEESAAPSERAVSDEKITPIDAEKPAAFQPKYAEGYMFSLLSATGYGLSPVLVRIGLENQGTRRQPRRRARRLCRGDGGVRAACCSGPGNGGTCGRSTARPRSGSRSPAFLVFFSQMFLYMAMSVAPVTVVSPINRLSILFRLYLQPPAQSAARGVRRPGDRSRPSCRCSARCADAEHRRGAVDCCRCRRDVVAMLNWRWP